MVKNQRFINQFFFFNFLRTVIIYQNQVFDFLFRLMIMNFKTTRDLLMYAPPFPPQGLAMMVLCGMWQMYYQC